MASATTALATLAPYQPPEGLGPREILAHAREHIDKLTKRHLNLQGKIGDTTEYLGKKLVNAAGSGIALGTSALFGFVNGRYGGDKGYVAPYGAPVDLLSGLVAHVVGYTDVLGRVGSALVHTVGDAAWGSGAYRWAHNKGVELAARVAAEKAGAPGAGAGAAGPNGAGAGPRGGTTYAVPQK
jgi:hypothetical protein